MFNKVMTKAIEWKLKLENDVRGVTAVEYAIIAVAMSAIILFAFNNGDLKAAMADAMKAVKDNVIAAKKTTP
ncbi:Flp family type IVb pilin [Vibrio vulnificus]|uniref:Flp family type IVb pilin n=1 Tax=Vibrio vulnificus TaxID=672 RepID=UPI0005043B44|nr:Flp family type IVb pilin [Vibrio vulnificus]EGQ7850616.1 Flp family type IVb pilin [Vibrio vulnificus]EGQ9310103.1 Flp family type IVb pilin [Vibrio vulnificus]EHD0100228.1 Flp family type IVb pilin [Vibrio vulnificus]EHH0793864.1 Flp family type IVb pilin [Vibrio vulnificus]EHK2772941.1 Flp family type IVb pilin [Vibrio vulnificus]